MVLSRRWGRDEGAKLRVRRRGDARVCVCVLVKRPSLAALPILRRLYGGAFAKLLFLAPFTRSPDKDVITVYRGGYVQSGYVSDALAQLEHIDCDHFVFVEDDVLLNPMIDRQSFANVFPVGRREGFLPGLTAGDEADELSCLDLAPRLLFPKSMLFGSGVEFSNLVKYLPQAKLLRRRYRAAGVAFTDRVALSDALREPSADARLLYGDSGVDRHGVPPADLNAACFKVDAGLAAAIGAAKTLEAPTPGGSSALVDLPIPVADLATYSGFCIVPKTSLTLFAHYLGVAAAANLPAEFAMPMALFASCPKVWTARSAGLDMSGLRSSQAGAAPVDSFRLARFVALRIPQLRDMEGASDQDDLLARLDLIRRAAGSVR